MIKMVEVIIRDDVHVVAECELNDYLVELKDQGEDIKSVVIIEGE